MIREYVTASHKTNKKGPDKINLAPTEDEFYAKWNDQER